MKNFDKAIKMCDKIEVTPEIVRECIEDYREDPAGCRDIKEWVEFQYPRHPEDFRKELIKRMKKGK